MSYGFYRGKHWGLFTVGILFLLPVLTLDLGFAGDPPDNESMDEVGTLPPNRFSKQARDQDSISVTPSVKDKALALVGSKHREEKKEMKKGMQEAIFLTADRAERIDESVKELQKKLGDNQRAIGSIGDGVQNGAKAMGLLTKKTGEIEEDIRRAMFP